MSSLKNKAKTGSEIEIELGSIKCMNIGTAKQKIGRDKRLQTLLEKKWVTLSDAQKELGEIETQFAEEVMKYKLELEKERSELKQKLRQWMKVYGFIRQWMKVHGFTIGDDIGFNKLKELLK